MSDTTQVRPALTAEEWAVREKVSANGRNYVTEQDYTRGGSAPMVYVGDKYESGECIPELRHALAALALHGQPFGFTREDVNELLLYAQGWDRGSLEEQDEIKAHLRSVAARIAALLPPEAAGTQVGIHGRVDDLRAARVS